MNIIEKTIINHLYKNIVTKGEYPEFGFPECRCNKCMFYGVACVPTGKDVVGCFHGWKREID